MQYIVRTISQPPDTLEVTNFRPESSPHRPKTSAQLRYDAKGLHGVFHVQDQYVRSIRTRFQDEVWKDSCVEMFIQPKPDHGYFNLEMNAGGAHLCWYITDPTRVPGGLKQAVVIPPALGQTIQIQSSLPQVVDPEIPEPISWNLKFFLPFALLENYVGPLGDACGQSWRGNFFKCAEDLSHPHWASWSPVDEFNFHLPRCFGTLLFS